MASIYIPLHKSEEFVAIPIDGLASTDPKDVLMMLMKEKVPLEIWYKLAVEYHKQGREDAFEAILNVAIGQKQKKTLQPLISSSSSLLSAEEEQRYCLEWQKTKNSGNFATSMATSALFDALASHYLNIATDPLLASSTQSFMSDKEKDKRRRDIHNQVTAFLQQADHFEKSRFLGESSEWLTKLIAGLQYYAKKDDAKATQSLKASLALFETRAARLGLALVLIRTNKYMDALQELSRVYMSIYGAKYEPIGELDPDRPDSAKGTSVSSTEMKWFSEHLSEVKSTYNPSTELLTTYFGLRPCMALVWSRLGCHTRAIEILNLQIRIVSNAVESGGIESVPRHHDRTLAMLGTLLVNKYGDVLSKAKTSAEAENAGVYLTEALQHFKSAFQLNPNNPNVLNHLSNLFFTQKSHSERDYSRIDSFAKKAKEVAMQNGFKEIQAESCYYLARSHHARGEFTQAQALYAEASALWPAYPLPLYGLGQMNLHKGETLVALEHFSKLDARFPDLPETKSILGHIHYSLAMSPTNVSVSHYNDHFGKAAKFLARALQLNPSNLNTVLDLAQLKERSSPQESMNAYLQACDIVYQDMISDVEIGNDKFKALAQQFSTLSSGTSDMNLDEPGMPEWVQKINMLTPRTPWNNLSVLRMQMGHFNESFDSILRTILLGACTNGCNNASVLSSNISPAVQLKRHGYVNPASIHNTGTTSLSDSMIFTALFGKSMRDSLDSHLINKIEEYVLDHELYLLPLNVTVGYNLALWYEKTRRVSNAIKVYESILARYPDYIDAKLRISILKRDTGKLEEAETLMKEIMEEETGEQHSDQSNTRSLAGVMLANLLLNKKDYNGSKVLLDKLVNKMNKITQSTSENSNNIWSSGGDMYALTQYANFFLMTSYASPNREKNLKWATDLFTTVLKHAPGNIYAANGLAIVTVLKSQDEKPQGQGKDSGLTTMSEAKRQAMNAFLSIREACPTLPDIQINLGHFHFAQGDYRGASKHYQAVWTKYGPTCVQVQQGQVATMLARSQSELGQFEQAKRTLQAALHYSPQDNDLWFNLAVLCKDYALAILKRVDGSLPKNKRNEDKADGDQEEEEEGAIQDKMDTDATESTQNNTDSDLMPSSKISLSSPTEEEQESAISQLLFAAPLFQKLQNPVGKYSFSTKKCEKFSKLCENNRELAEEKLATFRQELARIKALRDARLAEAKAEEERQREALAKIEEEERQKLAALNQAAEEARLRSQALLEEWAEKKPEEESGKKSGRRRTKRKEESSDDEEVEKVDRDYRPSDKQQSDDEEDLVFKGLDYDEDKDDTGVDSSKDLQDNQKVDAETKRRNDLEEMARRRNASKRKRDSDKAADKESSNNASTQSSKADQDDESPVPEPKRKKLKEKSADEDDVDLAGMDF